MKHTREWYIMEVMKLTESMKEEALQKLVEKLQRLNS